MTSDSGRDFFRDFSPGGTDGRQWSCRGWAVAWWPRTVAALTAGIGLAATLIGPARCPPAPGRGKGSPLPIGPAGSRP